MQENLMFWNNWEKPFRTFYITMLGVLTLCILFAGVSFFYGDAFTIGWEKDIEIETTAIVTDTKTVDFFNFNLETNSYLTRSWIDNGKVSLYPAVGYAYLITIVL